MTLQEHLLGQWLPAKEDILAPITQASYVSSVRHYLLRTSVTPRCGPTPPRVALPAALGQREVLDKKSGRGQAPDRARGTGCARPAPAVALDIDQ